MKMTTIARKVFNLNDHDNMTLDRLVNDSRGQVYFPVEKDQNYEKEETAYSLGDWRIVTNYGRICDHEKY